MSAGSGISRSALLKASAMFSAQRAIADCVRGSSVAPAVSTFEPASDAGSTALGRVDGHPRGPHYGGVAAQALSGGF